MERAGLEACIQSLENQTLQSQIICYSSTPLDSIKELCQRYAIPFYQARWWDW